MSSLSLGSGAWSELEACDSTEGSEVRSEKKGLKQITTYSLLVNPETAQSALCSVLENCTN